MQNQRIAKFKAGCKEYWKRFKECCCCCFSQTSIDTTLDHSFKENHRTVGFYNPHYQSQEEEDIVVIDPQYAFDFEEMMKKNPFTSFDNPLFNPNYEHENDNPMDPTSSSYQEADEIITSKNDSDWDYVDSEF